MEFYIATANLFLATLSGWSLKNITQTTLYSTTAYTLSLVFGIIGILRFSHPNIRTLQKVNSEMFFYIKFFIPFCITAEILRLTQKSNVYLFLTLLLTTFTLCFTLWYRYRTNRKEPIQALTVQTIWNTGMLLYAAISTADECYWTFGLILLILLNHFGLQHLTSHYDIYWELPLMQLVCFCFFIMFSLNSVNEIEAYENRYHKLNGKSF